MRPGREARRADTRDWLAGRDVVTYGDLETTQVSIGRIHPSPVVEDIDNAACGQFAREDHGSTGRRADDRAQWGRDIHARVELIAVMGPELLVTSPATGTRNTPTQRFLPFGRA